MIPDVATVANALVNGEIDWVAVPTTDLLPMLKKSPAIATPVLVPTGLIATMRFNQLQKPFDNPAIRRAIVHAVQQADACRRCRARTPAGWRDGVGYFCPGTPMASAAGMENLTSPRNLEAVKKELAAAGYKGERVVLLMPMDIPSTKALAEVTADMLTKIGINLDAQAVDWATVVQRRVKMDPVEQGGWSIFQTSWGAWTSSTRRCTCSCAATARTVCSAGRSVRASRNCARLVQGARRGGEKVICQQLQLQAFQDVPYIPLGQVLVRRRIGRN